MFVYKFLFIQLAESVETVNQEKMQLQSELNAAIQQGDDSRSDISESLVEQHKELVNTVSHKNKQISDLLNDIEVRLF